MQSTRALKTFWMKKIRPESEQPFSGVRSVLLQHLAPGFRAKVFRCPRYYYVSAADLQESKGWKNKRTGEKAHTEAQFKKIGMKIFVPAFCVAVFSLAFSLFSNMSSMIAITLGVLVAIIFLVAYDSKENKPQVFLKDSERFLSLTGPLSMLPQLLGCLGGVFTAAGVGEVIAQIVEKVVPKGNVNIGIIVYAVGMVLFTMIMGNAFAAITVMTVGIGAPFVLAYGANPVVIGMIALTCGYCGTLMTPMAANFNIVPVAILNMKDRWGVIKNQVLVGLIMLVFQICYMIVLK